MDTTKHTSPTGQAEGALGSLDCPCRPCNCPCTRPSYPDPAEYDDEDGYTLIDSDDDSVTSGEHDEADPVRSLRQPSLPSILTTQEHAHHLRLLLRYRFAAPSESAWTDAVQLQLETERLRRESQPVSMEASFTAMDQSGIFDDEDTFTPQRSMSLAVEASPHSPLSSLDSSIYLSGPSQSSRRQSMIPSPLRSDSLSMLHGIGSLFDQNVFTPSPLKVNAEPEYCFGSPAPPRSFSVPNITQQGLESIDEQQ